MFDIFGFSMQLLPNGMLFVTRMEFDEMPNYSGSLPTGTTPGKAWRRAANFYKQDIDAGDLFYRGVYGKPYPEGHEHAGQVPIGWRKLVVDQTPGRISLWLKKG